MSKILIIRFSALGDVAMTIPVIQSLAMAYPMHEITVLSAAAFKPLFEHLPANVRFIGADLKQKHKGVAGLNRLYNELKINKFDFVADFHSVLRSHYLRSRFALNGLKTASIDKGRQEKKSLTLQKNKQLNPLNTSFERYQKVLEKLGFSFQIQFRSIFCSAEPDLSAIVPCTGAKDNLKWIGIAPFAKHKGKIYPLELQEQVIAHFAADKRVKVFLFGGGAAEKTIIQTWCDTYPAVVSVVGKLNMSQELLMMSQLDLMFSMDSANMHLASLVGTKVVSLWGATHPYAGFMGWNQSIDHAIQIDLPCRPCSIYGQKACYRNDYACLYRIRPETIIHRIATLLF